MMYVIEYWVIDMKKEQRMNTAKIRILRLINGATRE